MFEDTSPEILRMQNRLWMERSVAQRAEAAFGLFALSRRAIIDSLPKDLSERDFKRQLYFRTYGEQLPDDFFKNEDENDG